MDPPASIKDQEPQVVFRPSKKRKQFRQRIEESDDATNEASAPTTSNTHGAVAQDADKDNNAAGTGGIPVAEALRLRNARKSRLKGVEFRPDGLPQDDTFAEPLSLAPKDELTEQLELGMSRRFAPPVGLVGELVNKHMEEYIESELARRHAADKAAQESRSQLPPDSSSSSAPLSADPTKHLGERPTMHGRLQEVDLGEETRLRNAAMTDQARRRLAGEAVDEESDGTRKRPRIGKDGKPWRGRKRRASDDVKRDEMVEALMRENRLDIYDPPPQAEACAQPGADEGADERVAEEFRREFMDAMAERRNQRRKAPAPPVRPGTKQEEVLKGPKLGGSRNARAAMRDLLLSQQEKDKKRR